MIGVLVLVLSLGMITTAVIKTNAERNIIETREAKLNDCLDVANANAWDDWLLNCNGEYEFDVDGRVTSCSVSENYALILKSEAEDSRSECIEIYSIETRGF